MEMVYGHAESKSIRKEMNLNGNETYVRRKRQVAGSLARVRGRLLADMALLYVAPRSNQTVS